MIMPAFIQRLFSFEGCMPGTVAHIAYLSLSAQKQISLQSSIDHHIRMVVFTLLGTDYCSVGR